MIERLLRLSASLEEEIIRLEQRKDGRVSARTALRLRVIQGEILRVLHDPEGDSHQPD